MENILGLEEDDKDNILDIPPEGIVGGHKGINGKTLMKHARSLLIHLIWRKRGIKCPLCGQHAGVRRETVNCTAVIALIELYKMKQGPVHGFVHKNDIFAALSDQLGAVLALLSDSKNSRHVGFANKALKQCGEFFSKNEKGAKLATFGGGSWAILQHHGLIKKGDRGFWMLIEDGEKFVLNKKKIPIAFYKYNGEVKEYDKSKHVSIKQILEKGGFTYEDLMGIKSDLEID